LLWSSILKRKNGGNNIRKIAPKRVAFIVSLFVFAIFNVQNAQSDGFPSGAPKKITGPQLTSSLRMFLCDGIFTQIMGIFTGGAFLVAFALLLGASNFAIGLIATLGPMAQLLQIPTIMLVEKK
jgi:hypothetical protein